MKQEVYVQPTEVPAAPSLIRRVSWGAIFAGFFVTIVIQLTLTLLGAAVGAASLEAMHQQQQSGQKIAIATGIWLLVSSLISVWVGACVSGRLSGGPRRADGLIHGVVTWSVSTCATLGLMATALGAIIGGTGALLGGALALGNLTTGADNQAALEDQVKNLFPQAGASLAPTGRSEQSPTGRTEQGAQPSGTQPSGKLSDLAQQDQQLASALDQMQKKGGPAQDTEDRDKAINILTTQHNMDQQQAQNLVQQSDQESQRTQTQTDQNAPNTAQNGATAAGSASRAAASSALWGFIALALGLIFAAWGGWVGTATIPAYIEPARPVA